MTCDPSDTRFLLTLSDFFESLDARALGLPTTEPDHVRRRPVGVNFLGRQYERDLAFFELFHARIPVHWE